MTIIPILVGGFGNRLYQIANALRLQEELGGNIKLFRINPSIDDVRTYYHLVLRTSDFDDFGGHSIMEKNGLPSKFSEIFPSLDIDETPHMINDILVGNRLIFEKDIHLIDNSADTVVMGYFFSYRFIESQIERVRNLLNPNIIGYINKNYPDLRKKRILGIHLRLGIDTDNKPAIEVDPSFYNGIINIEHDNFDSIYIISDNSTRAREFISNIDTRNKEIRIIEDEPMFIDMMILSECTTLIIAPSTLSAWSAYLNKHKNIYAPKIWVEHHWTKDIPTEWKIL